MRFGSLFCGIGGFDLGLERAGMECAWQVEIDPYAQKVLAKHWPDVRRHADVCTFPPQEGDWQVDVICGGFPCQDISYAGKGAGLAGERSGLWHQFARIIGEIRPSYVIVENVAALLTRGMGEVLGTLASLGYDAEWHVIPAAAVGAPHRRDRVWIVAYAPRERGQDESVLLSKAGALVSTVFSSSGGASSGCSSPRVPVMGRSADEAAIPDADSADVEDIRPQPGGCGKGVPAVSGKERSAVVSSGRGDGGQPDVADADNIRSEHLVCDIGEQEGKEQETDLSCGRSEGFNRDWWATEPNVGRVAHGVPSRVDRLRCLGNAVVPQVVELIGRAIMDREAIRPALINAGAPP